jgi:hypothetical protein
MSESIPSYTTALQKKLVQIDGEDWEIREMTADGRDGYLRAVSKTMEVKMVSTGQKDERNREVMRKEIKILSMSGAQRELLCATMVRIDQDGKSIALTPRQFGGWGSKMIEDLVKHASDLNGLEMPEDQLSKEAEKN